MTGNVRQEGCVHSLSQEAERAVGAWLASSFLCSLGVQLCNGANNTEGEFSARGCAVEMRQFKPEWNILRAGLSGSCYPAYYVKYPPQSLVLGSRNATA